jgi:hypothetical protein
MGVVAVNSTDVSNIDRLTVGGYCDRSNGGISSDAIGRKRVGTTLCEIPRATPVDFAVGIRGQGGRMDYSRYTEPIGVRAGTEGHGFKYSLRETTIIPAGRFVHGFQPVDRVGR